MRRVLTVACVAASFLCCNKSETIIDGGGTGINTPVYSSLANSFTYTINARQLTMTHSIPLSFSNNRLMISAAVTRIQGTAVFTLSDSQSVPIHADTFLLSGMYRVISVAGTPKTATVAFQGFTGTISYALVADSLIEGMRVTEFPNTEGLQWVYERYDSVAQRRDTVTVLALGLDTLPSNILARIWHHFYGDGRRDTQYVSVVADTLRIFSDPNSPWYGAKLVFPLSLGKRWAGDFVRDSYQVLHIGAITVPAGQFPVSYLVEEQRYTFNDYGRVRRWLAPNIGIVRMNRRATWDFTNESWELLSYSRIRD
ncbi:MAG TPA: hypothetical protein VNL69_00230 [Bacteroidota bacterium]|nr:hypothetical protein [Bacteroidota bacterium]